MGKKIEIALIDSGVGESVVFCENAFSGYSVKNHLGTYKVAKDSCLDEIGHGTAVISILNDNLKGVIFSVFKIYDNVLESEEERLLFTLKYILDNCLFDVIHISSGLIQSERYNELYSTCEKIARQGSIIVAAFDNDGSISYPAAFPFVIGVDLSDNHLSHTEHEYVENSVINIRASSSFHRLKWTKPATILAQGTSFSSAYISLKVIDMIMHGCTTLNSILEGLKHSAKNVYDEPSYCPYDATFVNDIKKAIAFPFNKEMHSLASFVNCLKFEIVGFYDSKYSLVVGKSISEVLHHANNRGEKRIQDIDTLDWESDFDTVILGHCSILNATTKRNWSQYIVGEALKHGKKVFSFEEIEANKSEIITAHNIYYPRVILDMVPKNRFGKLRSVGKPVLGILGTSSQQGKFTLQLRLRQMFFADGYKVAQLGTEPQSQLFGFDRVFPTGFNSTVKTHGIQSITLLNEYIWEISKDDADIVLIGSQSGTVPYEFTHLSQFPLYQDEILLGTQPDYIVLCINPHDDIDYISRSIKYIEGLIETKVIALVLFPVILDNPSASYRSKKRLLDRTEAFNIAEGLERSLGLNVYLLNDEAHLSSLYQYVVKAFSADTK